MRAAWTLTAAVGLLGWLPALAPAGEGAFLLDDAALARVTAGTRDDPRALADFDFVRQTASGRTVSGDGTLALAEPHGDYTLMLGAGAQSNLRSLVNINAIDASITVLLNLNINVDSSVGTLNQNNFSLRAVDQIPPPR
jgi:hypothetical protein